ncbi:MAG: hypothetical protein ACE5IR_11875 [bacterium]
MPTIKNRQLIEEYEVHRGATITADETSEWFNCEGFHNLRLNLSVIGTVSGTSPTLDVTVEIVGRTHGDAFTDLGGMTQITATSASESKLFDIRGVSYFRIKTNVGGTSPSFGDTDLIFALE